MSITLRHAEAEPELVALADRSYALTVLCDPHIPFTQDGTRRNPAFRAEQHAWYIAELARRGVPWSLAEGSVQRRVEQVMRALTRLGADPEQPNERP